MKHTITTIKHFISSHTILTPIIAVVVVILIGAPLVAWSVLQNQPVRYQATQACAVLTVQRAESLLGKAVINTESNTPITNGNTAISRCGYSDVNADHMKVVALAIRSAINDDGIHDNQTDFAAKQKQPGTKPVSSLGTIAFFDTNTGQLNLLTHRQWYILSYGVGKNPAKNSLSDLTKLARDLLAGPSTST